MTEVVREGNEESCYYPTVEMPHLGHSKHLCNLAEVLGVPIEEYKPLVKKR